MKNLSRKIYPFMVAIYPLLALWNYNIAYVNFSSAFRSILLALLATGMMWILLRVVFKDWQKAGLMTALGMFLFFAYGHVYILMQEHIPGLARHRYLLAIFVTLFLIVGWIVIRKLKNAERIELFITITSILLVSSSVFQLLRYQYLVNMASQDLMKSFDSNIEFQNQPDELLLPDIYLIILDAYTRSDVLKEFYDYDNSPFLNELTEMGFFIGECSLSNYANTRLTLPSVMNFNYIPDIIGDAETLPSFKSSRVRRILGSLGYTTVTFENRIKGRFNLDEDIHLSRNPLFFENMDLLSGITEFESMLIETSIMMSLFEMNGISPESLF